MSAYTGFYYLKNHVKEVVEFFFAVYYDEAELESFFWVFVPSFVGLGLDIPMQNDFYLLRVKIGHTFIPYVICQKFNSFSTSVLYVLFDLLRALDCEKCGKDFADDFNHESFWGIDNTEY